MPIHGAGCSVHETNTDSVLVKIDEPPEFFQVRVQVTQPLVSSGASTGWRPESTPADPVAVARTPRNLDCTKTTRTLLEKMSDLCTQREPVDGVPPVSFKDVERASDLAELEAIRTARAAGLKAIHDQERKARVSHTFARASGLCPPVVVCRGFG
jgi:hypothetical protein